MYRFQIKTMSIMLGFNSQESRRLDILLICRHCSCLPAEGYSIPFGPYILLSIISAFMLIKYEETVSIGLLGSGLGGLSAAAPAEQLRAFLSTKPCSCLPAEGYPIRFGP